MFKKFNFNVRDTGKRKDSYSRFWSSESLEREGMVLTQFNCFWFVREIFLFLFEYRSSKKISVKFQVLTYLLSEIYQDFKNRTFSLLTFFELIQSATLELKNLKLFTILWDEEWFWKFQRYCIKLYNQKKFNLILYRWK
jgi:hypothetical protein